MKRNRTQWRDDLSQTSWQDFERLLARHYREEGYEVEHSGTAGTASRFDGGVDLVLRRDGETVLVQCKHWNASQVPHNDVHQLLGLLETRQAERAVLITSGEFTPAALYAATRTKRIRLIDGAALRLMVDPRLIPGPNEAKPSVSTSGSSAWAPVAEKAIDAFMDVRTSGRWRNRRQTPEAALKELGLRMLIGAVLVLIAFFFIRSQVQNLQTTLARPASRPASSVYNVAPASGAMPQRTRPAQAPLSSQAQPMTPEQLEDWKRKNAEAMEVLEKTTPSVYE